MTTGWTHTETPWKVADQKEYIYANNRTSVAKTLTIDCHFMEAIANAAFIVRAVNSHEELLQACKNAEAFLEDDCCLTKLQVLQSLTNAIENASA